LAYKDHRHGFYNDHYEMTKCALIKESIWENEDDLTRRIQIKSEDIIAKGDSITGIYGHPLGSNKNESGLYGTTRIYATLDGGNLKINISRFASITDPTSSPLVVCDTITAGAMANITSIYMTVTMHSNTITKSRFIIGTNDGKYYLTPCVNASALTALQDWHWINGVIIDEIPQSGLNTDKGIIKYADGTNWDKPSYAHAMYGNYQFQIKNAYWGLKCTLNGVEYDFSHVYPDNDDMYGSGYNGLFAQMSLMTEKITKDTENTKTSINLLNSHGNLQNFSSKEFRNGASQNITANEIKQRSLDNLNNSYTDRKVTLSNNNYYSFSYVSGGNTKLSFCLEDGTELFSTTYPYGTALVTAYANEITFLGLGRFTGRSTDDPIYELYRELTGFYPYRLNLIKNYANLNFNPYDGDTPVLNPYTYGESAVFNAFEYYDINYIYVNLWLEDVTGDPDSDEGEEEDTPEEGKEMADETIDDASLPSTSALDIGVIAVFNPTTAQMQALTQEMQQTGFLEEVQKLYKNSPLEGIMSCHVVPINVETSGSDAPHFGNWTFETTMAKVSEQFYTVNFGSIKLEKKFASFLDYSPYTSVQIYLPYIGYRELDVDDCMGKTIGLKYNFDIITGAILAQVTVDGSVHYQYSGSAIMQFPLTASNHNNLISSIVGLVTSGATTIAGLAVGGLTGGVGTAMAVGGAMSLASSAVHTVASSKPEIQHGGSFAMTNGFLSVKTPYLVCNRPNIKVPEDFEKYTGRMCNKTKYVYDCSGYTEYMSIDVDSVTALDDEKAEIESILKGGFYA